MNYEIDKPLPEDEGDGLPHIAWRLRIIIGTVMGSLVIWVSVVAFIRFAERHLFFVAE